MFIKLQKQYLQAAERYPFPLKFFAAIVYFYLRLMKRFLDGPACFPQKQAGRRYRSPAFALLWWLLAFGSHFFTLPTLFIFPAAFIFLLHSIMQADAAMRLLVLLMLSLLLSDFIVGSIFWPFLKLKRIIPHRVQAGQNFVIKYEVENKRFLPALTLQIDPDWGSRHFKNFKEASLKSLSGKTKAQLQAVYRIEKRGKYFLKKLSCYSEFPFSICRHICSKKTADYLIVHPVFQPLKEMSFSISAKMQSKGLAKIQKMGETMEFQGCRDFREGDNPRYIHWQSTAKKAELIVREFQEEFINKNIVLLDTQFKKAKKALSLKNTLKIFWNFFLGKGIFGSDGSIPELEAAISLTAAISDYLIKNDSQLDLYVIGRELQHIKAGRNYASLENILDLLAIIEEDREFSNEKLLEELFEKHKEVSNITLIILSYDKKKQSLIEILEQHGLQVKCILIGENWQHSGIIQAFSATEILQGKVLAL